MKNLKNILITLEIVVLLGQICIHFDYMSENGTRYKYHALMNNISDYVSTKKLNDSLIYKFEAVFSHYDDHYAIKEAANSIFVGITQIILVILSIIGIILNLISINENKKKCAPIVFFIYVLIVGIYELIDSIINENSELSLNESELELFKEIKSLIEEKLALVKKRVLFLRIYSGILVGISIFHLSLSVYFFKSVNKVQNIQIVLENSKGNSLINDAINNEN